MKRKYAANADQSLKLLASEVHGGADAALPCVLADDPCVGLGVVIGFVGEALFPFEGIGTIALVPAGDCLAAGGVGDGDVAGGDGDAFAAGDVAAGLGAAELGLAFLKSISDWHDVEADACCDAFCSCNWGSSGLMLNQATINRSNSSIACFQRTSRNSMLHQECS